MAQQTRQMATVRVYGATALAKALGCSLTKVKYLWTGRTDKAGNVTPPELRYGIARNGQRFSTAADINTYLRKKYGREVKLVES